MPGADKVKQILLASKGFDRVLHTVKIISAGQGSIKAELKVSDEHVNILGGLHGGMSATIVDEISSLGLLTHANGARKSVSVNMNISYLSGAKKGDIIEIIGKTLRAGKTLAFLQVEIKNKETGALLVKGSHTKFLLDN